MAEFNSLFFANEVLEKRKQQSFFDLQKRKEEVFKLIPNYQDLSYEITSLGASLVLAKMHKDEETAKKLKTEIDLLDEKQNGLLISNGFSKEYLKEWPFCTICKDSGYFEGKLCSCMVKENAAQKQKYLSSLSPMPKKDFSSFDLNLYPNVVNEDGTNTFNHMSKILNFTKEYSDKFTTNFKGILMMGTSGLGKTHLACSIAKECMEKGFSVIYTSSQALFNTIEEAKYSDSELLKSISECDLFILDDLGSEYLTHYSIASFYNIVNNRTIKNLPTIYTSNLKTQDAIYKKYPEKIASRILGQNHILIFKGNDNRLK